MGHGGVSALASPTLHLPNAAVDECKPQVRESVLTGLRVLGLTAKSKFKITLPPGTPWRSSG